MTREQALALGKQLLQQRAHPATRELANSLRIAYLISENYGNYDPLQNGEALVLQKLSRFKLRTVFDVGANLGAWARLALKYHPRAHCHCFEIVPAVASGLKEKMRRFPHCLINEFGLSNSSGKMSVKYYPSAHEQSSLLDYPVNSPHQWITAYCVRGDEYMLQQDLAEIDYLKIDVEGAELLVLTGFQGALDTGKIKAIQFEYGKANIVSKHLLIDLYRFLEQSGFVIGKIYPSHVEFQHYDFIHENFIGPNYLAIRKQYSEWITALSLHE